MNWYSGDIAEAVKLSKSKNAIFVVYAEGEWKWNYTKGKLDAIKKKNITFQFNK